VDENRVLADDAQSNSSQPITLTPEVLSAREPDRRIPQEMPEDQEQQVEAQPVVPTTRASDNNTVVRHSPSTERPAIEQPKRVSTPPVHHTSNERPLPTRPSAERATSVVKSPVKETLKKETVREAVTTPPPSTVLNSTAGWRSYSVGKGVTLAQVFRSANLPLPDLMAMTRAQAANKPLSNVKAGQTVRVKVDAQGRVDALHIDAFPGEKPVVFVRTATGFVQSQ
ncbi:MAG: LysM-like peptidoglycan-binding domain-containing protein, partial [Plesiomonas sp.]